jgi:hypothetical protein
LYFLRFMHFVFFTFPYILYFLRFHLIKTLFVSLIFPKYTQCECILSFDNSTATRKGLITLHPGGIWTRNLHFWKWTRWPLRHVGYARAFFMFSNILYFLHFHTFCTFPYILYFLHFHTFCIFYISIHFVFFTFPYILYFLHFQTFRGKLIFEALYLTLTIKQYSFMIWRRGAVAPHPPQEQKTRVRIQPGY